MKQLLMAHKVLMQIKANIFKSCNSERHASPSNGSLMLIEPVTELLFHDSKKHNIFLVIITCTGRPSLFLPQATVANFFLTASATGETNFSDGNTLVYKNSMEIFCNRYTSELDLDGK